MSTLIEKINALLAESKLSPLLDSFLELDPQTVQEELAGSLRAIAVHQLRTSNKPKTKLLREKGRLNGFTDIRIDTTVYPKVTYAEFIAAMQRDKQWATDDLAIVLGEALGMSVYIQMDNNEFSYVAYEAGSEAPVINLTNKGNVHWTFSDKPTMGDGNCLFNAFALGLHHLVGKEVADKARQKLDSDPVKKPPTPVNDSSTFAVAGIVILVLAAAVATVLYGGLGLLAVGVLAGTIMVGYRLFDRYYGKPSAGNGDASEQSHQKINANLNESDVKPKNENKKMQKTSPDSSASNDSVLSEFCNRHGMWGSSKVHPSETKSNDQTPHSEESTFRKK